MSSLFLKDKEFDCLCRLYAGEADLTQAKDILEQSGILVRDTAGELQLREEATFLLKPCLKDEAHMKVSVNDGTEQKEYFYYLLEDQIVLMEKRNEGCAFLNLPTIKYAVGSVISIFRDDVRSEQDENCETFHSAPLTAENYEECLYELITEEQYKRPLKMADNEYIFTGVGKNKNTDFFMAVRLKDDTAYYYRQDFGRVTYGKSSKVTLINDICHWMLYKHRELIQKLLRRNGDAVYDQ